MTTGLRLLPATHPPRAALPFATMPAAPFSARQRLTLLATSVGLFMIFLDATIVNVALPDIQEDFDAGEQGLQWVVAAYSLTMGMFIMSAATLADQQGRRRVFIAGMVLFAGASALCGLAPTLLVLNIGRALQGVGAATVNVASLALVSAAFLDPKAKAKAIGIWTGIASVGLAIGPTVGGFLTETLGWRSIFFVNVGIAAVGIVLVRAFVEESHDPTPRGLDLPGQVLFIVAVGALTYALIEGPHSGWLSPVILGLLIGSAVLVVAFVVAELRARDPMMDVRVFRDRVYTVADPHPLRRAVRDLRPAADHHAVLPERGGLQPRAGRLPDARLHRAHDHPGAHLGRPGRTLGWPPTHARRHDAVGARPRRRRRRHRRLRCPSSWSACCSCGCGRRAGGGAHDQRGDGVDPTRPLGHGLGHHERAARPRLDRGLRHHGQRPGRRGRRHPARQVRSVPVGARAAPRPSTSSWRTPTRAPSCR